MKLYIHGFSQEQATKMGLSLQHLAVLRWFVDLQATDRMTKYRVGDETYYWVNYQDVLDDMPILGIKKRRLQIIFKELTRKNILKHHYSKKGGSFSFYKIGDEFINIVF